MYACLYVICVKANIGGLEAENQEALGAYIKNKNMLKVTTEGTNDFHLKWPYGIETGFYLSQKKIMLTLKSPITLLVSCRNWPHDVTE